MKYKPKKKKVSLIDLGFVRKTNVSKKDYTTLNSLKDQWKQLLDILLE